MGELLITEISFWGVISLLMTIVLTLNNLNPKLGSVYLLYNIFLLCVLIEHLV